MADIYGKGAQGKATRLHAEIVRARAGGCQARTAHKAGHIVWHEYCAGRLECSHIITRRRLNTRTELGNALNLCSGAHRFVTAFPLEHAHLVDVIYGPDHRTDLYQRAMGITDPGKWTETRWEEEADRLEQLAKKAGIR